MVAMALPKVFAANEDADQDALLIERALDNDIAAFESLVARYQTRITAYAARMLGSVDDAEDVAQETFIKAYRSLDSFRGASSFSTWLYRIATNLCIDRARAKKRRPQSAYSLDEPFDNDDASGTREIADFSQEPMRGVERDELRRQVRETVMEMPDKLRAVLVMCDIQGMAYEQIAQVLGCPIGTVKSRLFHARADLARRLRPYMNGAK